MTQIGIEFVSRLFPVYLLSRQKVHHAVFQLAISCCQPTGRNISRFAWAIYSSAGDSTNFVHFVLLPIQRGCCVCILYITLAAFLATFLARLVTTLLTTLRPQARKSNARKKCRECTYTRNIPRNIRRDIPRNIPRKTPDYSQHSSQHKK